MLEARLTSHFANNTATLFDFELAEEMNKQYFYTLKKYNQYPFFDRN